MAENDLSVLIIDEDPARARVLEEGLQEAGYSRLVRLDDMTDLLSKIYDVDPDVIVIDLENPNRDTVEQLFRMSRQVKRPVAMFVGESDAPTMKEAIRAGVTAYVVDELKKERVQPVVEMAIERFEMYRELEVRASKAEMALAERKTIERAKGVLMAKRQMSEQDAFESLRRAARGNNRRVAEIAESILAADELGL